MKAPENEYLRRLAQLLGGSSPGYVLDETDLEAIDWANRLTVDFMEVMGVMVKNLSQQAKQAPKPRRRGPHGKILQPTSK
jgi:hypothetical protein